MTKKFIVKILISKIKSQHYFYYLADRNQECVCFQQTNERKQGLTRYGIFTFLQSEARREI